MKILTSTQIRQADAYTIANEPVTPLKLMERAAEACARSLVEDSTEEAVFQIFCGPANNGGDGLALARLLQNEGYRVNVFVDEPPENSGDGIQVNYLRLSENPDISVYPLSETPNFDYDPNSIIIDSLFGIGLNRPLDGIYAKTIEFLNTLPFQKVSIDIPSGLYSDGLTPEEAVKFKADKTLSFEFWKKAFLHPETGEYCGIVQLLQIGLLPDASAQSQTDLCISDGDLIQKIYKPRNNFAHKGNFGKTALVGGSFGKMGAVVLATHAALRTGSGITYSMVPSSGIEILQTLCPEAMCMETGENYLNKLTFDPNLTYGIGPGLGTNADSEQSLISFLKAATKPVLLDADALNIISGDQNYLNLIPKNSILTPHPKEFDRLFGESPNSFERLDLGKTKSRELGIYIVLKGHRTQIVTPDGQVFYNVTGNAGMAKGGSGDVLLGIITSLLAQDYSPEEAAIFGVWLHGAAGDLAARKISEEAMLPSDLIAELGRLFKILADNN